jgi:superfamily I DNA/RNA helicase
MRREHREAMWDLYVEYERCLGEAGTQDFNDLLIMARDAIRDGAAKVACGAVIVDEVQDLTLVGLELLHAIAGDGPDRLLIVGDGQQAVYPGGFNLAEAGVNVAGRATVLKVNYRNTAEILDVATLLVAGDTYDDLEGTRVTGERPTGVVRTGRPPLIVKASDQRSLDIALTRQIEDTVAGLRVPHGDMAVLVHRLSDLEHYLRVLRNASIPTVELTEYDGISCDQVKVGTFKRAKGLEFKYVLLPGLRDQVTKPWSGESDDAFRERSERLRRELFVGMTRARDGLWLGYLT